jgi:hypothetical protein
MFKEFATSNHPWAVKFREFATKAFGIDFSGPPPPLNENVIDWNRAFEYILNIQFLDEQLSDNLGLFHPPLP